VRTPANTFKRFVLMARNAPSVRTAARAGTAPATDRLRTKTAAVFATAAGAVAAAPASRPARAAVRTPAVTPTPPRPSRARRRARARARRVTTVPAGQPSTAAASSFDLPSR